ncbi:MAG: ABC transporter ATP-binding protein [Rhodobacteraceae bacterium]|nr:ABC transporter ATP-binding protein [Paracoccaceae bacterium]MCY4138775.1 ABC transporter ATP-binding protein [Paracoccaceae bacterium]
MAYGQVQALFGVSFSVSPGEILCLMGRNGAGKTTVLKSVMNHLPLISGRVSLDDTVISDLPAERIPRLGIGYIPQGRRLFAELTVDENLEVGLMARGLGRATKEQVLELFPRLRERMRQQASTLSGGEQQMLALARAFCVEPRVLLLDEPTEGLQPSMIELIRDVVVRKKRDNVAIVLVEQRVDAVISIADRVAFIEDGRSRETVRASALEDDHDRLSRYLGV